MSSSRRSKTPSISAPPAGTRERRTVCRYTVVLDKAWLGWWEGQTFQSTPAKIIDISLRGALLIVESFPPKGRSVWFCPPVVTTREQWIEVKLVDMKKRLFGPREVRIAARKVFRYEIFKTVVFGPDAFVDLVPPAWLPEDAEERDWW
jgi:hypothetical protein